MRIRFLEAAQGEVDDAAAYYEEREEGRGHDFLDELDRAIRRIKSFPLASTEIEPGIPTLFASSLSVRDYLRYRRRPGCCHCRLTIIDDRDIGLIESNRRVYRRASRNSRVCNFQFQLPTPLDITIEIHIDVEFIFWY